MANARSVHFSAYSHLVYIILILYLSQVTNSLFFLIGETEKKCFIEDLPEDTILVGKYKLEVFDKKANKFIPSVSGLGVLVEITDANGEKVLSRVYASSGRFTFKTHMAGEHVICLHSNSTAWFGSLKLRVHLEFESGDHLESTEENGVQRSRKLSDLEVRVNQLLEQVQRISKEQSYQREREERFRELSESTNSRVFWWSVVQVAALIALGFWHTRHLRSFFEAKKLA